MKYCLEAINDSNVTHIGFFALQHIINNNVDSYKRFGKTCEYLCESGYIELQDKKSLWSETKIVKLNSNLTIVELNRDVSKILNVEALRDRLINLFHKSSYDKEAFDTYVQSISERELEHDLSNIIRLYVAVSQLNQKGIVGGTYKYLSETTGITTGIIRRGMFMLEYFGLFNNDGELSVTYKKSGRLLSRKGVITTSKTKHKKTVELGVSFYPFGIDYSIKATDREVIPKNICGYYFIHNDSKEIIYIGKSKDLKSRLSSHFAGLTHTKDFSKEMVYFSIIEVDETTYSETSNFFEKDLIKTFSPKYNVIFNKSKVA